MHTKENWFLFSASRCKLNSTAAALDGVVWNKQSELATSLLLIANTASTESCLMAAAAAMFSSQHQHPDLEMCMAVGKAVTRGGGYGCLNTPEISGEN